MSTVQGVAWPLSASLRGAVTMASLGKFHPDRGRLAALGAVTPLSLCPSWSPLQTLGFPLVPLGQQPRPDGVASGHCSGKPTLAPDQVPRGWSLEGRGDMLRAPSTLGLKDRHPGRPPKTLCSGLSLYGPDERWQFFLLHLCLMERIYVSIQFRHAFC